MNNSSPRPRANRVVLVANFKSHKTRVELETWISTVSQTLPTTSELEVIVSPSFPYICTIPRNIPLSLCAQDVSPYPQGSYTGAVSATQLADLGVSYCLVGHSERRHYFHETHADIANKVRELVAVGITPILCLSREDIIPQFAAIDDNLYQSLVCAFEPVEAIGTTLASQEDIISGINLIHHHFKAAKVLYGGSVSSTNLSQVIAAGANGALVGTASLDPVSFSNLVQTASKL